MRDLPERACRTVFVGAHMEGRRCLEGLLQDGERFAGLVTLKAEWAAKTSGAVPFDDLAAKHCIPLLKVRDLNHPKNVERLRALEPDLILVIGWTRLVGPEILSMPAMGCIGFHASLLPRYRGRAPVNWALINGETETGNSMIYLSPGVDTGDIVDQRRIPITDQDDCRTLYEKVGDAALEMLRQHLPALKAGTAPRRRQDEAGVTEMPRRRPEDGIIDWSQSARGLYNWVRALTHPYPGAFTFFGGRKVFVWRAKAASEESSSGEPGTILGISGGGVEVASGSGAILLERTQVEGESEEEGAATARRLGWRAGSVLGATCPAGEGRERR